MMKTLTVRDLEAWMKRSRNARERDDRKAATELVKAHLLLIRKDDRTNRIQVSTTPWGLAVLRQHGITGDLAKSFEGDL